MITKNAADYNGTVPEKYDVVSVSHKVFAEYGNQGTDFKYITREGFGWMNASFQLGMQLLNAELKSALNQLTSPDLLFQKR
jgi:alpha,alpha-trehalase